MIWFHIMRYVNHHKKISFAWYKNAKPKRNIKNKTCERFRKRKVRVVRVRKRFRKREWRRGVVVITAAQLHSTKSELRFCAGSNPARDVSEICDGEDLWQWSWLEIRLNACRRSTIPQKQFIIIIIDSFFKNLIYNTYGFDNSHTLLNSCYCYSYIYAFYYYPYMYVF